jgi:hypothetical protein
MLKASSPLQLFEVDAYPLRDDRNGSFTDNVFPQDNVGGLSMSSGHCGDPCSDPTMSASASRVKRNKTL